MKVFLSHSGPRSSAVALALRDWLPNVINAINPWMSVLDIDKGANWAANIASELHSSSVGILCLTPENLRERWVLFEAGALSKTLDKARVCSYLVDLQAVDLDWPLAMFQATRAEKEDTKRLVHSLNRALGPEARPEPSIDKAFDVWWPHLEKELSALPPAVNSPPFQRSERDLLQEILLLQRRQLSEKRESEMLHRMHTMRAVMTEIFETTEVDIGEETAQRLNMLRRELGEANQAFQTLLDHLAKKGLKPEVLIQTEVSPADVQKQLR